jgi:hypothetical protein
LRVSWLIAQQQHSQQRERKRCKSLPIHTPS